MTFWQAVYSSAGTALAFWSVPVFGLYWLGRRIYRHDERWSAIFLCALVGALVVAIIFFAHPLAS